MSDDLLSLSFSTPRTPGPVDDPLHASRPDPRRAVYLVGRADGQAGRLRDRVGARELHLVAPGPRAFGEDAVPGLVLLAVEDLSASEFMATLAAVARGRGEWLPMTLSTGSAGEVEARPVSLGYGHPLEEALAANSPGEDRPLVLEFRRILDRISRARHDLNNPLTSALAETQLLLMDEVDPECRTALETVQRQLRRMRDMIEELRPLRFSDR